MMKSTLVHKRILENLNQTILVFDQDLKLSYINISGEMLFKDSARHLIGSSASDLFNHSSCPLSNILKQCVMTREVLLDHGLSLDLAHRSVTVNICATPITTNNELLEIIVELQPLDRHLRISHEEQLIAQQNTARMLVRGLAHEIKNPLGGLRGAAQLLDLELEAAELKEYTQIIISESDRLQALMDRMLGPNKPPNKTVINIHELLERIRQLIQVETNKKIIIKRDYDPSIPLIKADHGQIVQALLNIARNAVQALETEGQITFRTRICRQMTISRQSYKLVSKIDIIDNGPGIKPEMINKIFYPMITGRAEGTGLGLSIAQSLIYQHNGFIECQSIPGETVFSIYLPVENNDV
jgi:two-component system nitrogen regulation sensor histidine kinase GlnL